MRQRKNPVELGLSWVSVCLVWAGAVLAIGVPPNMLNDVVKLLSVAMVDGVRR